MNDAALLSLRNRLPYRPCAGVMLINSDNRIFTGERIDTPGAWQMPQGGIDDGEEARRAALRELEEETGVPPGAVTVLADHTGWLTYDLPDALLGKALRGKYRGQKQKWFLMRLQTDDSAINIDVEQPEFSRWKWSTREELLAEIVDFKRTLYQQILAQFQNHL